jgi:tRNA(Arg) A34 adenosine deaminase TadA
VTNLDDNQLVSDETLLLAAVEIARAARAAGNHPFGALLADDTGRILLTAQNTVVTASDVTGHAETNLVRLASGAFGRAELGSLALFSSTEPCAMCAGAIYWSGIGRVVYALAEDELGLMTGDDPENPTLSLACRQVFAAGQRPILVDGPFDLLAAWEVHDGFWRAGSK